MGSTSYYIILAESGIQRSRSLRPYTLEFEMNEDATGVLIVLFKTVVQFFYLRLHEESDDVLFQLSAALTGDNLDYGDSFFDCLGDDAVQLRVDCQIPVIDIMQIQFNLNHRLL